MIVTSGVRAKLAKRQLRSKHVNDKLLGQMLYLVEVLYSIHFLESRLEEFDEKADMIVVVTGRIEGLSIQELLARVNILEGKVERTGSYERGDSLTGYVAHIEERCEHDNESHNARNGKLSSNLRSNSKQYFKATNMVTEEAKVTLAMMHLSKDAKLWWRSPYADIQEGRCTIGI
ncbi:senescence-specific cysteine protease sag39 [Cucumis melo var. makuwa]|uniref:Senescence-specific cysteine protease sag39 n=1 Tax=Cucumis melo var. makuwa TaxID=1194695 RepID=A0A5A7V1J2_CUCMM|nr:senescence-specific cysteine protease sag39 [Cucumis melo var. makuwa]